ncbi:hypothetical protein [Gilliamella sp. A7]|uniref:hypothetical protein n=1 Tax=Gilliamella sp. A7 TaxID=1970465 RepID=UPI0020B17841|nr:hypothetical protein [Gilliamella sp. A7]
MLASPILPPPAAMARPAANCDNALMVSFSSSVKSLTSLPYSCLRMISAATSPSMAPVKSVLLPTVISYLPLPANMLIDRWCFLDNDYFDLVY